MSYNVKKKERGELKKKIIPFLHDGRTHNDIPNNNVLTNMPTFVNSTSNGFHYYNANKDSNKCNIYVEFIIVLITICVII